MGMTAPAAIAYISAYISSDARIPWHNIHVNYRLLGSHACVRIMAQMPILRHSRADTRDMLHAGGLLGMLRQKPPLEKQPGETRGMSGL
jgi:hypothetical protein